MKTTKELLVDSFSELSELEGHQFKSRAYRRACEVLSGMSEEEFDKRTTFIDIFGIGRGINDKVQEFRQTKTIKKLQQLREETKDFLNREQYKVRKSFITKRIPLEVACEYAYKVERLIFDLGLKTFFAGSLRRRKKLIADIDVIVICSQAEFGHLLNNLNQQFSLISAGDYKASYMIDPINKIQLDIIRSNKEEFPFQLFYLTGSKEFNIKMRGLAKSKGYRLNQTGIYDTDTNERVSGIFNYEKEIFDFLGIDYVEPYNR